MRMNQSQYGLFSGAAALVASCAIAIAAPPEGTHPDAGSDTAGLNAPPGSTPAMVARGNRVYHGLDGGATCTGSRRRA